jgi:hypothetical protein
MRLTEPSIMGLVAVVVAATSGAGERSPELLDLRARIDYGFYTAEPRAIVAAVDALDRLDESSELSYLHDFAALRLAQLDASGAREARRLKACADRAPEGDDDDAAEAWILVAACGVVAEAPERRIAQALDRARALDKGNPRIALVEAWQARRLAAERPGDSAPRGEWQQAVSAFDNWQAPAGAADWGHAEALTGLAEVMLDSGEVRVARDLVEQALWLVPDYRSAVELRSRIR